MYTPSVMIVMSSLEHISKAVRFLQPIVCVTPRFRGTIEGTRVLVQEYFYNHKK